MQTYLHAQRGLKCCVVGEHMINTQGLPPYHTSPNRLFFWEEVEVN
jgi:hypothetical protein